MTEKQKNFHLVYFHSTLNHCFTVSFNLSWLKAINCHNWRCFKVSYLAVILTTVCVNISYFVFDVCFSCYCESLWQEPWLFSPLICTFFLRFSIQFCKSCKIIIDITFPFLHIAGQLVQHVWVLFKWQQNLEPRETQVVNRVTSEWDRT